jgi:hypothetical protein
MQTANQTWPDLGGRDRTPLQLADYRSTDCNLTHYNRQKVNIPTCLRKPSTIVGTKDKCHEEKERWRDCLFRTRAALTLDLSGSQSSTVIGRKPVPANVNRRVVGSAHDYSTGSQSGY